MDKPLLEQALERLLQPKLGYLPARWPETLYIHLRERALAAGQSETEYLEFVIQRGDPARMAMIIDAATIGHTATYRHPEQFALLQGVLLELAKKRAGPIRIWCAGCSTGEEAYSAAHAAQAASVNARVLATDVNPVAIAVARSGVLPQRRPVGTFLPKDWTERVPEALRKLVRFEVASMTAPRPALDSGPFDVIFCRNVLIYFEREQVPRLLERLAAELLVDGHLVISPAESVLPLPPGLERDTAAGWLRLTREEKAKKVGRSNPPAAMVEVAPPSVRGRGPAPGPPRSQLPAPAVEVAPPSVRGRQSASGPPLRAAEEPLSGQGRSHPPRAPGVRTPTSLIEEATRLLSAARAPEAEKLVSDLLNGDPDHLVGWFLLGEALFARGERSQARAAFLRAARCPTRAASGVEADALRRAATLLADTVCDPPVDR